MVDWRTKSKQRPLVWRLCMMVRYWAIVETMLSDKMRCSLKVASYSARLPAVSASISWPIDTPRSL